MFADTAMGRNLIDAYYNNTDNLTEMFEKHPTVMKIAKYILESMMPAMELQFDITLAVVSSVIQREKKCHD